jgi:hypothetical protein
MPSRRDSDPCLTCGAFSLFSIGIGLTVLMVSTMWSGATTPRYDANGTQLPSLVRCPGTKFLNHHGDNIQIIENEDIPLSPRCFTMPMRTYHRRPSCFETNKEECTVLAAALRCYNPGDCPQYHIRHSIFLNANNNRNGNLVTSQAVCCW